MINYKCYSDGAYSSLLDAGGIGIVLLKNGKKVFEYSKKFNHTTNNQMEIIAVLAILKCFKSSVDTITIYTDSMYVIGCITLNWTRKKNIELWELLDLELERVSKLCPNIKFIHVKGHSNNLDEDSKWNNYVDLLAVNAYKDFI